MRYLVSSFIKKLGYILVKLSDIIERKHAKLISLNSPRSLYKISNNNLFWLNNTGYLDRCLIDTGIFERRSTSLLPLLIKEDDVVLDVGANIGYYTVLISRIVGEKGKVFAFEPTKHFGNVLEKNLYENKIDNVQIFHFGLSNKKQELDIDIGPSSATIHSPEGYDSIIAKEKIQLSTLDQFVKDNNIVKIDFIKIDIDGHEPLFFNGAWETLDTFSPIILCEISHLHYFEAGVTAWEFYRELRSHNYNIYNEDTMEIMNTETKFLRQCANFDKTTNLILSKKILNIYDETKNG